jgi:hypothetical protein
VARGGIVEWIPGWSGGMPMTPRNGRSFTVRPRLLVPVMVAASSA